MRHALAFTHATIGCGAPMDGESDEADRSERRVENGFVQREPIWCLASERQSPTEAKCACLGNERRRAGGV